MTYRSPEDHAKETNPVMRALKGMIKRLAITLSESSPKGALWQVRGQHGGPGGDETYEVEIFPGIGFYSRPPSSGAPEAIAVGPGATKGRMVVATRDEKTRQAVAGELLEDETIIFNSQALVIIKANGTVEIRLPGGQAVSLVTFDTFMRHTHLTAGTGAAVGPTPLSGGPLTGTTVIKGQ